MEYIQSLSRSMFGYFIYLRKEEKSSISMSSEKSPTLAIYSR